MSLRLRIAGLVSLALHLSVVAGMLLVAREPAPGVEAPDKPVAVELVMEEQKGAGKTEAAPPATQQTEPQPAPQPSPKPPEAVAEPLPTAQALPPPTPQAPPAKAAPAADRPQPAPEINLGGTDSESNAIVLLGPDVIPATPDKKARNRPPLYPEDAARRGQQGTVLLVIHVGPSGLPSAVGVERSSGYPMLDKSAIDAVTKWTFVPAVKDGLPVAFDFHMNFTFAFE